MGTPFSQGVKFLLDGHRRFFRPGVDVFLRVQNFTAALESADLGFSFTPADPEEGGFRDIIIQPPVLVQEVSLHDIGILGARLNFGARHFFISDTFVASRVKEKNFTDPFQVWRDKTVEPVVGLFYNSRLYSLESITHEEAGGGIIQWHIIGQALEGAST